MVYKNLLTRLSLSIFFIAVYFLSYNNKYLLFSLGTLIYCFVLFEIFKSFKNFFLITLFYLSLSYLCFALYFFIFFDFIIFNIFVFTIILFDSFSYISGKLFGKNNIFKYLSPKKTLEGYLGGVLFVNIFLISFFLIFHIEMDLKTYIILLNLIICISITGDLIESYFKRKNNIKDSSKYLLGHGGFFDRFDSFISSIIFLTLFSSL